MKAIVFDENLKLDKNIFQSDKISLLCGLSYYVKIIYSSMAELKSVTLRGMM